MTRDELKIRTQQAIDAIRVFKEKDYGWSQMEKMLHEILIELDDYDWHTETPAEEGWYLIAFNYEFEEGVRYTTDYFKDGKWAFPMVRDISKLRAWQRIEPYKEENNGTISD